MMSELAFNVNGDRFDVPAHAVGWRVRRLKPNRGAPEIVYDRNGRPLVLSIDADIDDLREAVKTPARYRLDPVNVDERPVEGVPSAYVQVVQLEEPASRPREASPTDAYAETIREAMRLNVSLAQTVVERFPEMLVSASTLLRAADAASAGAWLPGVDESVDGGGDQATNEPKALDLNAAIAQGIPHLVMGVLSGKIKIPGLGALIDWRKNQPAAGAKAAPSQSVPEVPLAPTEPATPHVPPARPRPKARPAPQTARQPADVSATAAAPSASSVEVTTTPASAVAEPSTAPAAADARVMAALSMLDPSMLMHFLAIQSALTPEEAQLAQAVALELEPAQLHAWIEELTKLDTPAAVARIRDLLGRMEVVS